MGSKRILGINEELDNEVETGGSPEEHVESEELATLMQR